MGKYSDMQKEQALAMMVTMPISEVSRVLGINDNTLRRWRDNQNNINPELVDFRKEKKMQFVENAWKIIGKANDLLEKKLDRALNAEEDIEKVLSKARVDSEIEKADIDLLIKNIGKLGTFNFAQLSSIIGTLYDKQALVNKEATIGLGADVGLEEILKNLQGDEM